MEEKTFKAEPLFQRSEYISRLERVRASMSKQGLDLLLVSDPCNIYYLTGYDGWSFYTLQSLLVSLDREPIWFGRQMDIPGVRLLSWLSDESIISYPDKLVQSSLGHPAQILADCINREYPSARRIGVEKNCYYLTVDTYELLNATLQNAPLIDASLLINWVRFIKSSEEMEVIKRAAKLLDLSMSAAVEAAIPGVRECDIASAAYAANLTGTDSFGGVYTSSPAFISSAERTSAPHLCWSDRRIENLSSMNLELMGNCHRYQVTMARTVYFGKAPVKLKELEAVVLEGIENVLEFIKPGVTCEEVEGVWRKSIAKYGLNKESRCGYSQGIAYPPTGGELTASFRPGDQTVLQPNVVMHFLPAIWNSSQSLTISEPIQVTEEGCERLSQFKRELIVKDKSSVSGGAQLAVTH